MAKIFSYSEIPFGKLSNFGLTPPMVADFPQKVIDRILSGGTSPLLQLRFNTADGNSHLSFKARFRLAVDEDGEVNVYFQPVKKSVDISNLDLSDEDRHDLLLGKPVTVTSDMAVFDDNGEETSQSVPLYLQLHTETNSIVGVPSQIVGRNMKTVASHLNLDSDSLNLIQSGNPVTVHTDEGDVTVGISLNSENCIAIVAGDVEEWKNTYDFTLEECHYGTSGCWKFQNGVMEYMPAEQASEEKTQSKEEDLERTSQMGESIQTDEDQRTTIKI